MARVEPTNPQHLGEEEVAPKPGDVRTGAPCGEELHDDGLRDRRKITSLQERPHPVMHGRSGASMQLDPSGRIREDHGSFLQSTSES